MSNKRNEGRRRREELIHRNESPFARFMNRHKGLVIALIVILVLCGAIIFLLTRSKPEPNEGYDFDITLEPEEGSDPAQTEEGIEDITAAEDPIAALEGLDSSLTKDKGYKHYLLLGVDGIESGFKGKRSDAIMIVSINASCKSTRYNS